MPGRRLGILGGTFDPVHLGHMDLADAAHRALGLTEIVLVPSNVPPHRPQPITSAYHRFAMVAFAVQERPGWRAADLELRSDAPSFTSRTLDGFHHRGYRPTELFFVIGADAFFEIESWRDYPNILDAAHFVVDLAARHSGARGRGAAPAPRRAHGDRSGRRADLERPIDHFDRRADRRRVIHCDPGAPGRGRIDRRTRPAARAATH